MDLLFGSRVEERFSMPSENFHNLIGGFDVKENKEYRGYIQNIYFDTTEQALPLGYVVRSRRYLPTRSELQIDENNYYIDRGSLFFNKKTKTRTEATIEETINKLNKEFPLRLTDFRPYSGIQYERRVFDGRDFRITIDMNLESYMIDEYGAMKRIGMPENAQIEVKHLGSGKPVVNTLRAHGALPSISKHGMLNNQDYYDRRGKIMVSAVPELPDMEYEIKFDTENTEPFMRFLISVTRGELDGFERWSKFSVPYTIESFNEYRAVTGTDKKARLMYDGNDVQRIVSKDYGHFLSNGVLKRSETKDHLSKEEWSKLLHPEILGETRRIKRFVFVRSKSSGKLYPVTIDLNQSYDRQMYQLEVEYWRSEAKGNTDPESEVIEELGILGRHVQKLSNVKPSELRKEDWAIGITA